LLTRFSLSLSLSLCVCVCVSVCLSVGRRTPTLLHGQDATYRNGRGCPLLGGFAIGARVSLLRQHSTEREISASACTRSCAWLVILLRFSIIVRLAHFKVPSFAGPALSAEPARSSAFVNAAQSRLSTGRFAFDSRLILSPTGRPPSCHVIMPMTSGNS